MGSVDGLVRGIIVSFSWGIKEMVFEQFGDSDDSECVVRRSLAT